MITAIDVIEAELNEHGADFIGDSRADIADAILAALDAAGYAVVPKEPTKAMKVAACQTKSDGETQSYVLEYRAMLTAAKETP